MINSLEINLIMPTNRTESGLLVQPDGFGLDAADKKEHFHLNYTQKMPKT
jgi:hypothetical protein